MAEAEDSDDSGETLESILQSTEGNSILFIGESINNLVSQAICSIYTNPSGETGSVFFLINSLGGTASDTYLCCSFMDEIKKERDLYTICYGNAQSAAAAILANGTKGKRYAVDSVVVMVHRVTPDPDTPKSLGMAYNTKYLHILSKQSGRPLTELKKAVERVSYFTAKEAKDFGLIDKIIPYSRIPTLLKK